MVLTYTIVFYIYQRVYKAHKLNDKRKLTGGPSPTVQVTECGYKNSSSKFVMAKTLNFGMLHLCTSIFQYDIHKNALKK